MCATRVKDFFLFRRERKGDDVVLWVMYGLSEMEMRLRRTCLADELNKHVD